MKRDGPSTVPWSGLALGSVVVWAIAGSIAMVVSGGEKPLFGPLDTASLARVSGVGGFWIAS
jgi:hypothetical protein